MAHELGEPARQGKVPTYQVRFETYDDFLVEYTDQLRHGYVLLPLPEPLTPGSELRLKIHLPDESVLYVTGTAVAHTSLQQAAGSNGTRVRLSPLTAAQKQALQRCLEDLVASPSDSVIMDRTGLEPGPINILLVDDSVSMRIELGDAMRARGLRVRVAENGLVALSAALKRAPDLILTDVEMPVMDGWQLLKVARQRKRLAHVPVVFLTRLGDEMSRLQGYRLGVDDYLPKAMPAEEIVARLEGVLARRDRTVADAAAQGLRGELEHVCLGSLLAFIESERRTGVLRLRRGPDEAQMHLREGTLERVDNLGRYSHPHDRVFEMLSWQTGQFEFEAVGDVPDGGESTPLSYLLMEHARREDEAKAEAKAGQ